MDNRYYEGIGRRKQSSARVRIMAGSGECTVNGKEIDAYFTRLGDASDIINAFQIANHIKEKFDVTVKVQGGGVTGQRDAVKLGLARALVEMDEELRPALRHSGYLTRDPRVKERKKPGLKRARKAPTYTKR
ncbi:MAG: 30S ribosomal protein S9 [Chloroflexi bacterium]|jgi:small subunit ribosomal protein S9|nr:30S ribosomal protein S9 [Chloroflexota bacterium]